MIINWRMAAPDRAITTSKYAELAKCSADTALRDIRELLAAGVLVANPGGGRSASDGLASAAG